MVFSSVFFLFFFLPFVLLTHFLVGKRFRNLLLLLASLIFYAWGEQIYVLLMLCSIMFNFVFGILIDSAGTQKRKKIFLAAAVFLNLLPLFYFKYSAFFLDIFSAFFKLIHVSASFHSQDLHLPIGISFFTFQALSYVIDVYRGTARAQKNPLSMGLYISLFPQLIAGPIIRYHDVARQLSHRVVSFELFASGVERFVYGLGKKVLLANPMGAMADRIFSLELYQMTTGTAWLGISCYALQIFFDFSGYSDMAIGLGRMFGFRFLENFNYPYISRSIREFWRRWHISLSNWFRDYLYIPLGGSRSGSVRTGINLILVFFLCGIWHGASWNFVIWGLCHGFFLVLERGRFGKMLEKLHWSLQHIYVVFILLNTWVFFRVETLSGAVDYLTVMYGGAVSNTVLPYLISHLGVDFYVIFCVAVVFAMPVYPVAKEITSRLEKGSLGGVFLAGVKPVVKIGSLAALLLLSSMVLAVGSYNPFIYFRF